MGLSAPLRRWVAGKEPTIRNRISLLKFDRSGRALIFEHAQGEVRSRNRREQAEVGRARAVTVQPPLALPPLRRVRRTKYPLLS